MGFPVEKLERTYTRVCRRRMSRGKSGLVHQVTEHPEAEGERFNAVDMLPSEGYFKMPLETTRKNAEQSQQARLIIFH